MDPRKKKEGKKKRRPQVRVDSLRHTSSPSPLGAEREKKGEKKKKAGLLGLHGLSANRIYSKPKSPRKTEEKGKRIALSGEETEHRRTEDTDMGREGKKKELHERQNERLSKWTESPRLLAPSFFRVGKEKGKEEEKKAYEPPSILDSIPGCRVSEQTKKGGEGNRARPPFLTSLHLKEKKKEPSSLYRHVR